MRKTYANTGVLSLLTAFVLAGCTAQSSGNPPTPPSNPPTPPTSQTSLPSSKTAETNQEFTLSPGQETTINGANVSVYFLDVINDSRCASDVQCIQAGTVTISVKVSGTGLTSTNAPLTLTVGSTEHVNDDYDLQFVKIAPERGKQSQVIPKAEYRATLKLISTAPPGPVTEINDPAGIIFSKEALLTNYVELAEAKGLWNPSIADANKADHIAQQCINEQEKSANTYELQQLPNIKQSYAQYRRQYVGYQGKNGHKLVWINFMKPSDDYILSNWKKKIIEVADGGSNFFNVLVDLDDQKCVSFSINGPG